MMKNRPLQFLILIILAACTQAKNKQPTKSPLDSTANSGPAQPSAALDEYAAFISRLDSTNVETASIAAKKYAELFQKEDVSTRDGGFVIFNTYYERLDKTLNELHEQDSTSYDVLVMADIAGNPYPVPPGLQAYNDRLKQNGFEVSMTEGSTFIQQDRDFLAKWFYSHVSPVMEIYLQQLNKEAKEGYQEDAGLTIEPQQYVNRLVWWENFIRQNPSFVFAKAAADRKLHLLTFFIIGMDNTPILDYESQKLDGYYKTAYTYLQTKYPDSETNRIVTPFFKALLQNDKQKAEAIINDYKKQGIILNYGSDL